MAASAHSWDFLLLRLRELRLPLLRGLGSGKKGAKQVKSIADILPPRGYQSNISGNASPPIRGDVQALLRSRFHRHPSGDSSVNLFVRDRLRQPGARFCHLHSQRPPVRA